MNLNQTCATKLSAIPKVLSDAQHEAGVLCELLQDLENRINPILRPDQPPPPRDLPIGQLDPTPLLPVLAQEILALTARLKEAQHRINNLAERVEC